MGGLLVGCASGCRWRLDEILPRRRPAGTVVGVLVPLWWRPTRRVPRCHILVRMLSRGEVADHTKTQDSPDGVTGRGFDLSGSESDDHSCLV